ncbi:MAG TPA: hypothetical protein VF193_01340 [Steroidobacter sp.]
MNRTITAPVRMSRETNGNSPWSQIDAYHWRHFTGRYYVERSHGREGWVYLGWHKPPKAEGERDDPMAERISPERRLSFEAAAADCAEHYRKQRAA